MARSARLALLYAMLFGWVGVYMPYFQGWLSSRGLTGAEIGLLLGVVPWLRMVLNPTLGQLADRTGRTRPILVTLGLVCAVGLYLYPFADAFAAYVLANVLVGAAFAPMVSLTDGVAVREARTGAIDYARVRAAGSLAFIVVVIGVGAFVRRHGYAWVPSIALTLALGMVVASLALPRPSVAAEGTPGETTDADPARPRADFRVVLQRPGVPRFLVGSALIQASHTVIYNFGTLHWQAAGIGQDVIGQLWAIGVVFEVGLFLMGSRIAAMAGPQRLMVAAGLGGALRFALLASTTSVGLLFVAQSLHALSFATLHLGALEYIRREIPEQSTATGLYAAAGPGIGMGIATPLAGILFDATGAGAFWAASGIAGLGAIVLLVPSRPVPKP